ncbi:ArsR/SmtB family transcription factor [Saccharicrinis fermentans]|uniref:Putative HTH-type transcriptional regulator YgaV n=1 Tax=Saccharicrinis fermentans DSM 9555 = JCM 21142 TaxID=869213 RepID=W7YGN0_9BACT|nr:metalloregulator ArsR/SmtB family transcription factor [Saccharicrinis fermentans]GAF01764.1 putative HTH-type transcriptional regulator YgaV [Saccharicrinis fermentans DSM 9555 = JCM 21142]
MKEYAKEMKIQDLDTAQLERAASMLKAIAHPMRIAILSHLEEGTRLTVTEIHKLLNIEQSTTSHHLGILKDKGVLVSQREGKNTYYSLKHESLQNIVNCVSKCTVNL